ncbi:MAG TPA: nitrile hydratase subunit alpha [Polyangiaceae bacterium]|nr:nitrile hydratase subunit alpha [Polyangiaceae bacterium]
MKETWLKIITRAWSEPAFKARLLAETDAVLKEYHVDIPAGVTYQVVEDQAVGTRHLVLPPAPSDDASPVIDNFNRNAQSGDPGF